MQEDNSIKKPFWKMKLVSQAVRKIYTKKMPEGATVIMRDGKEYVKGSDGAMRLTGRVFKHG